MQDIPNLEKEKVKEISSTNPNIPLKAHPIGP
jgi:hypothetical protein